MRLRFTIRDLLWLTVVACIVLAWVFSNASRKIGRYQYVVQPPGINDRVIDMETGQIWQIGSSGAWSKYSSPPAR